MDLNLKDKVALVTGGSHGIGRAICLSLAKEGCHIAFCSRNKRYDIMETATEISKNDVLCHAMEADASKEEDVKRIVGSTIEHFTKIDILINNVGGGSSWGNPVWQATSTGTWQAVYMQSFHSTVMMTNKVLPYMIKQKFGRVISIASIYGKENGGEPWYQSAKSAQISFMKSYASNQTYVRHNITFNTICPGFIDMPDKKQPDNTKVYDIPMGRFGTPEEIAPIVTLLGSEKSSYINGTCIVVDGGFTKSF